MPTKKYRLISWNVNGLRAVAKKGFGAWLAHERADIVGLQETKISSPDQVPDDVRNPKGFTSYWTCADGSDEFVHEHKSVRKGYSGVALYTRIAPKSVKTNFGNNILSGEGRVIEADYGDFIFFTIYFPNGKRGPERMAYKMHFYEQFLKYIIALRKQGKRVVFCGDVNTAHTPIDLARPKDNSKVSGFLPEERAWIDKVIAAKFFDTFRLLHPEKIQYSWWDQLSGARGRNVGWRIDYLFVSDNLKPHVKRAWIDDEVMGSDHAPVGLELEF